VKYFTELQFGSSFALTIADGMCNTFFSRQMEAHSSAMKPYAVFLLFRPCFSRSVTANCVWTGVPYVAYVANSACASKCAVEGNPVLALPDDDPAVIAAGALAMALP
jgi:hypothetical protein